MTTTTGIDDGTPIGCPGCGETDGLSTVELLRGYAGCSFFRLDDGSLQTAFGGYTDINWDTTRTVGLECARCGHQWDFEDYSGVTTVDGLLAALAAIEPQ